MLRQVIEMHRNRKKSNSTINENDTAIFNGHQKDFEFYPSCDYICDHCNTVYDLHVVFFAFSARFLQKNYPSYQPDCEREGILDLLPNPFMLSLR